jgi:hypothetical protein
MPIQSVPDGVLDVENATLRASGMVATKDMVIGKTTKKTSDVPTLEVFSENAATIELQSNLARSTNTSNAFARIKADSQALTFESGSGLAHDSKGDIVFSSIGDATKHMVIKGSTGKIGIGVENPSSALDIAGDINLIGQNAKIKMNSDVLVEHAGPHGRDGAAVLKKYPEIAFESGKFDSNDSTNTYVQAGYTVSSSSWEPSAADNFRPYNAFDGLDKLAAKNKFWLTGIGTDVYTGTGTTGINGDADQNATLFNSRRGEWIQLETPNKIKVNKFIIKSRTYDSISPRDHPKSGYLYASDNGTHWQEIKSFTNLVYAGVSPATSGSVNQSHGMVSVDVNSTDYYRYFRLQVTQRVANTYWNGSADTAITWLALGELEYYGYEEDPPTGDTSVDTTFTSIMNTPQTTGANVYVDAKLSADFTNQVTGPTPVGTAAVHDNTNKYWEMNGQLTSNITVEANTFLSGDAPHSISMWFNSSNLEANVSNSCIFSLATEEKLDSVNLDLQSNTWHNLTYAYQGEGGSKVTYLDGRKVAEDQAEDTFGEYPPFAMTGYSQGGYVVSADSEHSSAAWFAYEAFSKITSGSNGHLSVDNNYYNDGSGGYTRSPPATIGVLASTGATINEGDWLKIEMPNKIIVDYISQISLSDRPKDFKWYGSNDDYNWTQLLSVVDAPNNTNTNSFIATTRDAFRYFALVVSRVYSYPSLQYWRLDDVRLYGHRENDLVRLPDPTNVLKYPHVVMTGPAQRGYVVSRSTGYLNYPGWYAFGGSANWTTENNYSLSGGSSAYNPSAANVSSDDSIVAGGNTYQGDWIQLQLPHGVKFTSFKVSVPPSSEHASVHNRGIKNGILAGSNNGSSWDVLKIIGSGHTSTGSGLTWVADETKTITIDTNTTTAYKYIRLLATAVLGGTVGTYWSIPGSGLEFYGTGVDSIPIQIGGGNIDKVANFRVYDKFIDQNQALEIWDAQKDEFGRAKSSMTLHKGRLGIGTTEPEGRLAVADEPHNLEEFPPRAMSGYKTYFEGHGEFCASASSELLGYL